MPLFDFWLLQSPGCGGWGVFLIESATPTFECTVYILGLVKIQIMVSEAWSRA